MPGSVLVAAPATEPVSLSEAKAHLRVEHNADDTLITALIITARQAAEDYTGRALITQTWRLWLNSAPVSLVTLPRAPLAAITSVSLFDAIDNESIIDSALYFADTSRAPGQLVLRDNTVLTPGRTVNGIKIDYTCGYGNAAAVPAPLKQGILVHIAALYEQRGDAVQPAILPNAALHLYAPYRLVTVL